MASASKNLGTGEFAVFDASGIWDAFQPFGEADDGNPGCSLTDLAASFGVLNAFDLAACIALFDAGDPAADLAAPFGALNFFDLSTCVRPFDSGCPDSGTSDIMIRAGRRTGGRFA